MVFIFITVMRKKLGHGYEVSVQNVECQTLDCSDELKLCFNGFLILADLGRFFCSRSAFAAVSYCHCVALQLRSPWSRD